MLRLLVPVLIAVSLGLVGCSSSRSYVGTYGMVVSGDIKKRLEGVSPDQRQYAQSMLDSLLKMTVTINADGTYTMKDPISGKDSKGTYTVAGNTLTMSPPDPKAHNAKPQVLTFNPVDETLVSDKGDPVLKKK